MPEDKKDDQSENKAIALLISALALVLAFCQILGENAQADAIEQNIEATNLWAFFQAKTIRQTVVRTAAEEMEASGAKLESEKKQVAKWREIAQTFQSEPDTGEGRDQLKLRAREAEKKRDLAMVADHRYQMASAAVQIAIVLASAAIITNMFALVWAAGALGVLGIFLCALGFFFPTALAFI